MTERILREIERRIAQHEKNCAELKGPFFINARTRQAELEVLWDWLKSQPPTEAGELVTRAKELVARKGEMSIEHWNDKAQCLLAPIAHALEAAELQYSAGLGHLSETMDKLEAADAKVFELSERLDWVKHYLTDAEAKVAAMQAVVDAARRLIEQYGPYVNGHAVMAGSFNETIRALQALDAKLTRE